MEMIGLRGIGLEESLLGRRLPHLLHAGDSRRHRFCPVPEPVESVGLAVLVDKRFKAGGDVIHHPPANDKKGEISCQLKEYNPRMITIGLIWIFVLSMIIVRREEGNLRWATVKRRLRLNAPQDPTTCETRRGSPSSSITGRLSISAS
jgi:hypothetical protein